jgi:molybdenum cofactor biosynthesis enzyme MoaA
MTAPIHNYTAKLSDRSVRRNVVAALQSHPDPQPGSLADMLRPRYADVNGPISINLDVTVACNYRCPHCIDAPVLNTGHRFSLNDILQTLVVLRLTGLRSVILIGGGEPTLHPNFVDTVKIIKLLGLQCAVVTNGSGNDRIRKVANWLTAGDWIRLSLDAGRQDTFQEMHLPRNKRTRLLAICESAGRIKEINPALSLGFSFIVSWRGAKVNGNLIAENVDEIAMAAQLAKDSGFDFITFKPLLDRDERGGEAIRLDEGEAAKTSESRATLAARVSEQLTAARVLEDDRFRVYASPNLVALDDAESLNRSRVQPQRCHMRFFRQVVTPVGVYGCPAYRGNSKDQIGPSLAYVGIDEFLRSRRRTADLTELFNATIECQQISCLYNSTNWWLQSIYDGDVETADYSPAQDFFL